VQIVDVILHVLLLVTACTALVFLIKASSTLKLTTLNRGILLLYLLIALEIAHDAIAFFVMKEGIDDDLVTLRALILALVATAIYYATKVKRAKSTEPIGAAIICTVWLVIVYAMGVFFTIFW
jgi:hypothetical protein